MLPNFEVIFEDKNIYLRGHYCGKKLFFEKIVFVAMVLMPSPFNQNGLYYILFYQAFFLIYCVWLVFFTLACCSDHIWLFLGFGVSLRIHSEYGKTGTRKNSAFRHFSPSVWEPANISPYNQPISISRFCTCVKKNVLYNYDYLYCLE